MKRYTSLASMDVYCPKTHLSYGKRYVKNVITSFSRPAVLPGRSASDASGYSLFFSRWHRLWTDWQHGYHSHSRCHSADTGDTNGHSSRRRYLHASTDSRVQGRWHFIYWHCQECQQQQYCDECPQWSDLHVEDYSTD